MGRNSSGVKGIRLVGDDRVVGMVVADPEASLLTVCANGYGKRTPFGPNLETEPEGELPPDDEAADDADGRRRRSGRRRRRAAEADGDAEGEGDATATKNVSSQRSYRTQRRGGKGLRDIKTTDRNGPVIGIVRVERRRRAADDDRPRQDPADSARPTSASSAATRKA